MKKILLTDKVTGKQKVMSLEHFLKTFRWFTVGRLKFYIEKGYYFDVLEKNDRVQTVC